MLNIFHEQDVLAVIFLALSIADFYCESVGAESVRRTVHCELVEAELDLEGLWESGLDHFAGQLGPVHALHTELGAHASVRIGDIEVTFRFQEFRVVEGGVVFGDKADFAHALHRLDVTDALNLGDENRAPLTGEGRVSVDDEVRRTGVVDLEASGQAAAHDAPVHGLVLALREGDVHFRILTIFNGEFGFFYEKLGGGVDVELVGSVLVGVRRAALARASDGKKQGRNKLE